MRFAALLAFTLPILAQPIMGVVRDQTGKPVDQASVQLLTTSALEPIDETETDDQGRFRFPGRLQPHALLRAAKSGYVDPGENATKPAAPDVTLTLTKAAIVTGRAFDASGRPLGSARVAAFTRGANGRLTPLERASATVDDRGSYRLHGLPPGRYTIGVVPITHPGDPAPFLAQYSPEPIRLHPGEERGNVDLHATSGQRYKINGVVTGAAGSTGLVLFATSEHASTPVAMASTGSDNRFELQAPLGSYDIVAVSPSSGYSVSAWVPGKSPVFGRQHLDLIGDPVPEVAIALSPALSVEGQFVFENEPPDSACYRSASVALAPLDPTAALGRAESRPEGSGAFRIAQAIPNTRYRILISGLNDGCFVSKMPKNLELGEPAQVRIVLTKASGTLEGTAAAGSNIVIARADGDSLDTEHARFATTGPDGKFKVGPLVPGPYRAFAIRALASTDYLDPEFWADHAEQIRTLTIRPGEAAQLQLQPLTLKEAWK